MCFSFVFRKVGGQTRKRRGGGGEGRKREEQGRESNLSVFFPLAPSPSFSRLTSVYSYGAAVSLTLQNTSENTKKIAFYSRNP